MSPTYLGHVQQNDPLYDYLKYEIQPQISEFQDNPRYRVYKLNGSNPVFLYHEKYSDTRVIGKYFFAPEKNNRKNAVAKLDREYENLIFLRNNGFDKPPFYTARPLGKNADLNELLVVEYCQGELLSTTISRSIQSGNADLLYDRLSVLACFLARLHNGTAIAQSVNFENVYDYMTRVIRHCNAVFDGDDGQEFRLLRDVWRDRPEMWQDNQVYVHGDATPDNFMFADNNDLITFDLERCMYSDRIFDVGRIAGELTHFFLRETGNPFAAEPFIGHFLWEYAGYFPDRDSAFYSISQRIPFYMGLTFLRIARNFWIDWYSRRRLVLQAKECLRQVYL